jgi:hypothetical protein
LHVINELCKQSSLWVFKILQVYFNKKIEDSGILYFTHWMVISVELLSLPCLLVVNISFKFQILASLMT